MCHCHNDIVVLKLPCLMLYPQKNFNIRLLICRRNVIRSLRERILKIDPQKYLHLCTIYWGDFPLIGTHILVSLTLVYQR